MTEKSIHLKLSRELLAEIKKGNPDSGYAVANMILSEGPNLDPELLLIIVESILELSVLSGSIEAKKYLEEMWPTLKTAHFRRLKNNINR